ncbi:hypothetical protein SK128_027394 [Halocaridina rubra]|uniref:Uncharacterized protein n=1 Tax=Halocaridina rubra TaxID=373956 RepID=A0AAN8XCG2_HALRR
MSKQYDLLLQTLVDVQVIVDWFSETLPEDIGNFTSELPPALLTIHNTLNSSWMELLDGLHLNIKQRPELMSMNLQDICSMNESSFQDPNGENGRFYDILLEMCTLFGSLNIKTYNFWHQLEQLVINLRNDTREFSSKQLYNEIMSIVSRFREFLFQQTVVSGSQNMFLTSPEQHHWELPSYMQLENWKELLLRISERELNM